MPPLIPSISHLRRLLVFYSVFANSFTPLLFATKMFHLLASTLLSTMFRSLFLHVLENASNPATDRAPAIGRCRWLARVGFMACSFGAIIALTPRAASLARYACTSSPILPWVGLKAIEPFVF
jgi:hypothetical protein